MYTKGPWRFNLYKTTLLAFDANNKHKKILDLESQLEPTKADAYLIAAAPDMFEALMAVAEDDGCPQELGDIVMAAIRKAKGE